jgi:hypothetical protein
MAIQFDNTNTGVATLKPAATGTLSLTLPSADGTSGQLIATDGSGNLSFTTPPSTPTISQGNSSIEVADTGTGLITTTVDGTSVSTSTSSGIALLETPTAPTAAVNTQTTQIATTEFAVREALNKAVAMSIALG